MFKKKENKKTSKIRHYLNNKTFQCVIIGILTLIISFLIILNGAVPKKYKLYVGMISPYDITAPRNIENVLLTEQRAQEIAKSVSPVVIRKDKVPIETLISVDNFFSAIESARKKIDITLSQKGLTKSSKNYETELNSIQSPVIEEIKNEIEPLQLGIYITDEHLKYLLTEITDDELVSFKKTIMSIISEVMMKEITTENISSEISISKQNLKEKETNPELIIIGNNLLECLIKPNSEIDEILTEEKRKEAYENAIKNNKIIVKSGSRIVSVGDVITEDKMQMLKDLNLVETGTIDYAFTIAIFIMMLLVFLLLFFYMKFYCPKILSNRNNVIVLCLIIVIMIIIARFIFIYSPLLIPFSLGTMLIAILLDRRLALVINCFLAVIISFMTRENLTFLYMALISGSFTAFFISKVNQRSALSSTGLLTALINVFVVICMGMINKNEWKPILTDSLIVSANGLLSVVLTIGILPFWESTFNLITPFKLMELGNPNTTLLKRLLLEAPGTYHHSLMVGNLAEVATEALGGNALLARVGAYYHDIGKLRRPNFFSENQLSKNPHDKMSPSLSTLVIISHTRDGVRLAEKYKLPYVIRDIIEQHHGTTIVSYFYHKAKQNNQMDINEENYRYPGPKPTTKEAAIVMLADSVEAAVRSTVDKTEGKIEGLVRRIIKERLEDGQLDSCDLTLNDLDIIAKSFIRVFSGFFHARERYPDTEKLNKTILGDNLKMLKKINEYMNNDEKFYAEDKFFPDDNNDDGNTICNNGSKEGDDAKK